MLKFLSSLSNSSVLESKKFCNSLTWDRLWVFFEQKWMTSSWCFLPKPCVSPSPATHQIFELSCKNINKIYQDISAILALDNEILFIDHHLFSDSWGAPTTFSNWTHDLSENHITSQQATKSTRTASCTICVCKTCESTWFQIDSTKILQRKLQKCTVNKVLSALRFAHKFCNMNDLCAISFACKLGYMPCLNS